MTHPETPGGTPLADLPLPDPTPAPVEPIVVSRTRWGVTLALATLMLLAGFSLGYGSRPLLNPPAPQVAPSAANAGGSLLDLITAKVRHSKGNPRAPVSIIEYGDFT